MTTFSSVFQDARYAVSSWPEVIKFRDITIVRDIKGKISVYLEPLPGQNLDNSSLQALQTELISVLTSAIGSFFSGNVFILSDKEEWLKDLFEKIRILRLPDADDTTQPKWFTIERGIAKKAWINRNQREIPVWGYDDTQLRESRKPGVITFYSYKGGMGRTTALVATALELIRQHKNVLMIDTDLEAPGLSTFFFSDDDADGAIVKGTVDYLLAKNVDSMVQPNMKDYIIPLTSPNYCAEDAGHLYLVCSGKLDQDFLLKLARIDSQELVEGRLKNNLEQLLKDCYAALAGNGGVDYILIDSRAGFHDMAGVVTAQIPHGVVLFGKDSSQSWYGIHQAVQTIAESQEDKPLVMLVDSSCGKNDTVSDEEKKQFRNHSYAIFEECYYSSTEEHPALHAENEAHSPVFVPYSTLLAGDIPLYDAKKAEGLRKKLADSSYKTIAHRVMGWFGDQKKRSEQEGGEPNREQEGTA